MTQQMLSDEHIRRAFERRANVDVPSDLPRLVMTAIAAQPQRGRWQVRVADVLQRRDHPYALPVLVAVSLLVATMMAIALVGSPRSNPPASGHQLAFISGGDVFVVGEDGNVPRVVSGDLPGMPSRVTWVDPDTIVLESAPGGVYAIDLRSPARRMLAANAQLFAVSQDRRRVAVGLEGPDGPHLAIVEIASGLQIADVLVRPAIAAPADPQIVPPQNGTTGGPHAWSPDGRWLLGQGFDTDASATSGWIYQLDVQSGELRDLATQLCCGLEQPHPVLAPDGSTVAFVDYHSGAGGGDPCPFRCGNVWSLDTATGARRQLTTTEGSEIGPVFSPDGTWIAFMESAGSGYDIAVMRADGSERRRLTQAGDAFAPEANLEPFSYLAWESDGRGLTFMRWPVGTRDSSSEFELWTIALDGLVEQRIGTFLVAEFAP